MKRRVLLVEDDARVRRVLSLSLEQEGYAVHEAATAEEGLAAAGEATFDVVLLDIMLPDGDGFSVCRAIRKHSDVPVIMVTARSDSHDVVAGLEAGADDYVTKPLVAKELAARIRALLRRSHISHSTRGDHFDIGDLVINVPAAEVTRDGELIALTRTEFRLLCELAYADQGVCSREQLLERVWGYDYFGDSRIVDVHISRLRTKVEHDPAQPRHVVTVRGMGYRLVG
ncbi:response regulator [Kribbella deserti]|uniref:Response regulator n=1 Tax=Kribbella deserti TaxID=1926257 RepID=A0ABV6QF85_9ACTN